MKFQSSFLKFTAYSILLAFGFANTIAYSDASTVTLFVRHSSFNLALQTLQNSEDVPVILAREGILVSARPELRERTKLTSDWKPIINLGKAVGIIEGRLNPVNHRFQLRHPTSPEHNQLISKLIRLVQIYPIDSSDDMPEDYHYALTGASGLVGHVVHDDKQAWFYPAGRSSAPTRKAGRVEVSNALLDYIDWAVLRYGFSSFTSSLNKDLAQFVWTPLKPDDAVSISSKQILQAVSHYNQDPRSPYRIEIDAESRLKIIPERIKIEGEFNAETRQSLREDTAGLENPEAVIKQVKKQLQREISAIVSEKLRTTKIEDLSTQIDNLPVTSDFRGMAVDITFSNPGEANVFVLPTMTAKERDAVYKATVTYIFPSRAELRQEPETKQQIITVDNYEESLALRLGEKSTKVIQMAKAGFNVPRFFVVTGNGTGQLEITPELEQAFNQLPKPVIVRSSHPDEGRKHSFSGVFNSYPNVQILKTRNEEAVPPTESEAWLELFMTDNLPPLSLESYYRHMVSTALKRPRAQEYLKEHRILDFDAKKMNALIMEQIDVDVFAMFVTSKQGNPNEVAIHYSAILDKAPERPRSEFDSDFDSDYQYQQYLNTRTSAGNITYNRRAHQLEENELPENLRNVLSQFGEIAGKIEAMFGVQQIELGAKDGKVYVFQSRNINLGNPNDVPRYAHYKTIFEAEKSMNTVGYGHYRLPVLVIDSFNNRETDKEVYPEYAEWQKRMRDAKSDDDRKKIWKEKDEINKKINAKRRDEWLKFYEEHSEYILVIKDADDVIYEEELFFRKNYELINQLISKAKVVIRGVNQNAIRHEDWDNVDKGGIMIWGNEQHADTSVFVHKRMEEMGIYFAEQRKGGLTIQRPTSYIQTGDFLNVLSNTDGAFVWLDDPKEEAAKSELRSQKSDQPEKAEEGPGDFGFYAQMAIELLIKNGFSDKKFKAKDVQTLWQIRYAVQLSLQRAKKMLEIAEQKKWVSKAPAEKDKNFYVLTESAEEFGLAKDYHFHLLVQLAGELRDSLESDIEANDWKKEQNDDDLDWQLRELFEELDFQLSTENDVRDPKQLLRIIFQRAHFIEALPNFFPDLQASVPLILFLLDELYDPPVQFDSLKTKTANLRIEKFQDVGNIEDLAVQAAIIYGWWKQPKYQDEIFVLLENLSKEWQAQQKEEFEQADWYFKEVLAQAEETAEINALRKAVRSLARLIDAGYSDDFLGFYGEKKIREYFQMADELYRRLIKSRDQSVTSEAPGSLPKSKSELRKENLFNSLDFAVSKPAESRNALKRILNSAEKLNPVQTEILIKRFNDFTQMSRSELRRAPKIVGLLPNLARLPDLLGAIIENRRNQERIVVFAGTKSELRAINAYLESQGISRSEVTVTQIADAELIFRNTPNATLFNLGLPADGRYAEQIKRLINRSELRFAYDIQTKLASPEELAGVLGLTQLTESLRSELRARWMNAVMA